MESIHLNQTVNNHDIVIPFDVLKPLNHQEVGIIIFSKKENYSSNYSKSALIAIFEQYKNIKPFEEISDSVTWQKDLRNEW